MMIEYSFLCETELLIQKYQSDLVFVLSQPGVQVSLLNYFSTLFHLFQPWYSLTRLLIQQFWLAFLAVPSNRCSATIHLAFKHQTLGTRFDGPVLQKMHLLNLDTAGQSLLPTNPDLAALWFWQSSTYIFVFSSSHHFVLGNCLEWSFFCLVPHVNTLPVS